MVYSYKICELAIAIAYNVSKEKNPLQSAGYMVQGYNRVYPISELELECLYTLIGARLSLSISISAKQCKMDPENEEYILIFQKNAINLLAELSSMHSNFAEYYFRATCGFLPVPASKKVLRHLANQVTTSIFNFAWKNSAVKLDLSITSTQHLVIKNIASREELHDYVKNLHQQLNSRVLIGNYLEPQPMYLQDTSPLPGSQEIVKPVNLGLDLFVKHGTSVYSPLSGTVMSVFNNRAQYGSGTTVILKHKIEDKFSFFTLYECLSQQSSKSIQVGQEISAGDKLGTVATFENNGNRPSHVHIQVICDMLNYNTKFPGVVKPEEIKLWASLCPDPSILLGLNNS